MSSVRSWPVVVLVLGLVAGAAAPVASATSAAPNCCLTDISRASTSHGLRFSLSLRQATYAPDSLVQVYVEVRNTSSHAIGLEKNCSNAKRVWVEVLQGRDVVYPPVLHVPGRQCRPSPLQMLRPGESRTHTVLVVVRGTTIRGAVVAHIMKSSTSAVQAVYSKPLVVTFAGGIAPTAQIVSSSAGIAAVVDPRASVQGSMRYQEWAACPEASGVSLPYMSEWKKNPSRQIGPQELGCTNPVEWHAVVGWVGHPVVAINYCAPRADTQEYPACSASP